MISSFHISLRLLMSGFFIVAFSLSASSAIAQSFKPGRIVWIGYLEHQYSFSAGKYRSKAKNTVKYRYVEETDSNGITRLVEKEIDWNSSGEATSKDLLMIDRQSNLRFSGDTSVTCLGGGKKVDLLSAAGYEQLKRLETKCKRTPSPERYDVFHSHSPNVWMLPGADIIDRIPIPWEELRDDCSYSEEKQWTDSNGRHVERFSVSASPEIDAVMEVKADRGSEYAQFVPEPNNWISFSARSNVPAFFRFTLEKVSPFWGYATNAALDEAFFKRYGLTHLQGKYKDRDPDLIFDPDRYDGSIIWRRTGWDTVETVKEHGGIGITVTAMDFGAHGRLRAWIKGKCGGWQPVRILVGGREREFVTIPMDEDDNLIADSMREYAGDPGHDDDAEPKGDGTPGDGFTSFEEYRGFMTMSADYNCRDGSKDVHVRTDPIRKDLFIQSSHPWLLDLVPLFGDSSGLSVHTICPLHYIDNRKRIVNFTLHLVGPTEWQGKTVSQREPQHGLYLKNEDMGEGGAYGEVYPSAGPPKYVEVVRIDVTKALLMGRELTRIAGRRVGPIFLAQAVLHELGHAVGISHHDDGNITNIDEALIITGEACPRGTESITRLIDLTIPDGANACRTTGIARRHAQNSGDDKCPMKYVYWSYYEPQSGTLVQSGTISFEDNSGDRHELPAYVGNIRRYRMDLDFPGVGEFCENVRGGGINALPGDQNHTGDASHTCANQIHVNDVGSTRPMF